MSDPRLALAVPCDEPDCRARAGEPCSELVCYIAGEFLAPFRDVMTLPHAARVRAAEREERGKEKGEV